MKCPAGNCVWREKYIGMCIAPIDERMRRHCPLPQDDIMMTDQEALEYIKERYPGQEDIWKDYLKQRDMMKIGRKDGSGNSKE